MITNICEEVSPHAFLPAYRPPVRTDSFYITFDRIESGEGDEDEQRSAQPQASSLGGLSESLGINTNYADTYFRDTSSVIPEQTDALTISVVDKDTGKVTLFQRDERTGQMVACFDKDEAELSRWMLHREARRILSSGELFEERWKRYSWRDHLMSSGAMLGEAMLEPYYRRDETYSPNIFIAPLFRVVQCHQIKLPLVGKNGKLKGVELWQANKSKYVSFHNLNACGSVWTCPICAPKISSVRRDQIGMAYKNIIADGGSAFMVTFTIRHDAGDQCQSLVDKLKDAHRYLQATRFYKSLIRKTDDSSVIPTLTKTGKLRKSRTDRPAFYGWVGAIAALEAKFGSNGWHPHEHHLFFFDRKFDGKNRADMKMLTALRHALRVHWIDACIKAGLPAPSYRRGVDLRIALNAGEYIAKFGHEKILKWSIEKEMVQGDRKIGKGSNSRTPFQLLADSIGGDLQATHEFANFAKSFKGKRQLMFSDQLLAYLKTKKLIFDTSEESDAHLASCLGDQSTLMGDLTDEDFTRVKAHHLFGQVCVNCRLHGFKETLAWIRSHGLTSVDGRDI